MPKYLLVLKMRVGVSEQTVERILDCKSDELAQKIDYWKSRAEYHLSRECDTDDDYSVPVLQVLPI